MPDLGRGVEDRIPEPALSELIAHREPRLPAPDDGNLQPFRVRVHWRDECMRLLGVSGLTTGAPLRGHLTTVFPKNPRGEVGLMRASGEPPPLEPWTDASS